MTDQYFTPPNIAAQLVAAFRRKNESCIADFASGDGELLRAAEAKWPKANIIATDINPSSVRRIRATHPTWQVGKCDFLNTKSRRRTQALCDAIGQVSLIVLNPPFSCKGGQRHMVTFRDEAKLSSSLAMAFIVTAAEYLTSDGRIAAILPMSCLHSKKDSDAWLVLRKWFDIKTQKTFGIHAFQGCSAKTAIVTLTSKSKISVCRKSKRKVRTKKNQRRIQVKIVRGAMPIHKATNGLAGPNWPVVHTTNLRESKVRDIHIWIKEPHRYAAGPAVFLPRIGKPDFQKFVVYRGRQRLVLSDCVYALLCNSTEDAECLHKRLGNAWDVSVQDSYAGTCAPYLTIERLIGVLDKLGCVVTDIEAVGYSATQ